MKFFAQIWVKLSDLFKSSRCVQTLQRRTPETHSFAHTHNEWNRLSYLSSHQFKASFYPQMKSSEYQRLLLLLLPPNGLLLTLFLPLFLSLTPSLRIQFGQSGVGVSLLVIQPSLPPAIPPCPNPSLRRPGSSKRERESERESKSDPVPLRKTLRCQPAGFNPASAPRGPLCAPPRSRRDLSWGHIRNQRL